MINYFIARSASDYTNAKILFEEYATAINIDLCFQKFDDELSRLQKMYQQPQGGIILAEEAGTLIGCVGVRRIDATTGELKRMYVRPGHQQKGIGKNLLEKALELAKNCKYTKVKLDTLSSMEAAIRLYKANGFYEIAPYYVNPIPTALYFEKMLE